MPADQTIADNATMAGGGGVDGADPSDQITITMVGLGDTPPKAYIKYATMWGLWSKRVGSSADDIAAREGIVAWVAGVQTGKDAIDIENVMNSEVKRNEGGFMMGLGFYLREDCIIDPKSGELVSDGTWEYKPPCSLDVPLEFNVEFLQDRPFHHGVLSSKASGEPPLVLATSVFVALRHAVSSARAEMGLSKEFDLNAPATVDAIAIACGVTMEKLL